MTMDKYVVYKYADLLGKAPQPLKDCFVLRQQDVFGVAVLWDYAHMVQTQLELVRSRPGFFSDEEVSNLKTLAEDLATTAVRWQEMGGTKVPD